MAGNHGRIHVINSVPEFFQKLQDNINKYVVVFFTNSQTTSQSTSQSTSQTSSMTTAEADASRLVSPQLFDILSDKSQIISHDDGCRLMSPIFNELSRTYKKLIFLEVDFFRLPNLMNIGTLYKVKEVPSFAFLSPGDNKDFIPPLVGEDREELERRCMRYNTTA